jgi:hypothetical protein
MPNSPTEKTGRKQLNLNIKAEIVNRFKRACDNHRPRLEYGSMVEFLLENWLEKVENEQLEQVSINPRPAKFETETGRLGVSTTSDTSDGIPHVTKARKSRASG